MKSINWAGQDKIIGHILLYKEKNCWIAHCLEFDLLADAHDPKAAISRLAGVINTHISYLRKNHLMHQLYNPAPKKYWKMLAQTELMGEIILGAGSVGSKTAQLKINEPGKVPLHEMSRLNLEYRQFPRL